MWVFTNCMFFLGFLYRLNSDVLHKGAFEGEPEGMQLLVYFHFPEH